MTLFMFIVFSNFLWSAADGVYGYVRISCPRVMAFAVFLWCDILGFVKNGRVFLEPVLGRSAAHWHCVGFWP